MDTPPSAAAHATSTATPAPVIQSYAVLPPRSYADLLRRRSKESTSGETSMSASENEIVFSPLLSEIPFDVDSTFPQRRLLCSIRPPKREGDAPKSTLTFDANYAVFKQLARLMTTEFSCRILSSAWRLGLLMALDPYFVPDTERRSLLASIFILTLPWHPESEFDAKEVDAPVAQMVASPVTVAQCKTATVSGE
jgi:hypothetical protein